MPKSFEPNESFDDSTDVHLIALNWRDNRITIDSVEESADAQKNLIFKLFSFGVLLSFHLS